MQNKNYMYLYSIKNHWANDIDLKDDSVKKNILRKQEREGSFLKWYLQVDEKGGNLVQGLTLESWTVYRIKVGTTEDEMAGWHHRLDGRESE